MATAGGPKISRDGLVFAIDSDSNVRGFTKYGTSGTNNNHRAIRNLVDRSSTFSTANTSQLTGGVTYYTLYGLTYPESSQTPANRQGITLGFENITSAKLYDMSRDLGYFVFDENTNTWVPDSYFNGERINGHCYDTYDGQPSQHATFQADFDNIKNAFPNATHIVIGSHAAENNVSDSATKSRLESIGLPSDHTSGTRWEYVLAGKIGKPWTHHYVRENVSSAVANMVIGLPLEGKGGALTFDGTDDTISINSYSAIELVDNVSIEYIYKRLSTDPVLDVIANKYHSTGWELFCRTNNTFALAGRNGDGTYYSTSNAAYTIQNNIYYHLVAMKEGLSWRLYVNGVLYAYLTANSVGTWSNTGVLQIGGEGSGYYPNMELPVLKIYNKVLSTQEVQQNYNAYKNRFNL
jgi:hypothetical protein